MAHLIGETPPGPLTPPPSLFSEHTDIIQWLVALSCTGETERPGESPGTSIKVPNLSVYSSII